MNWSALLNKTWRDLALDSVRLMDANAAEYQPHANHHSTDRSLIEACHLPRQQFVFLSFKTVELCEKHVKGHVVLETKYILLCRDGTRVVVCRRDMLLA